MILFPAIDLKNGQCVRLAQGDFNKATIYEANPVLMAQNFASAGAEWMHVVDLDGAKAGEMKQFDLITSIAKEVPLKIEVGGGIRDEKTIAKLLNSNIKRVIIGSLAIKDKVLVKKWLTQFGPERIVLAFDVRVNEGEPEIMTHGWQTGSRQLLWDVLDFYKDSGLKFIMCTDVGLDGMLQGTNNTLYKTIIKCCPSLSVLASGGVSSIDDLLALSKLKLYGAIIGKAIYEGRIKLNEAIKQVKDAG